MKKFFINLVNKLASFWGIFGIGAGLILLGTIFMLINTPVTDVIGAVIYWSDGVFVVILIIIGIINFFNKAKYNE